MDMWDERDGRKGEREKGERYNWDNLYETLRYLFAYRNHYTDNLSIIETLVAENKFGEALETVTKMYEQFEITEEQNAELQGLETYIHWLQQLDEKEKTIYTLPESEIGYLVKFVATNTGRGKVFANNILCVLYEICIEDEMMRRLDDEAIGGLDDEIIALSQSVASVSSVCEKNALENITLIPNPTTGELQVTCHASLVTNIEVFDVYGRKLSQISYPKSQISYQIDISDLSAGIYFVRIRTESGEVVKKVIKQ
jgi:hypothetical protein